MPIIPTHQDHLAGMLDRTSICTAGAQPDLAIHHGDPEFKDRLCKHYTTAESNAAEQLIYLKRKLRQSSLSEFWRVLMEGMTGMAGAQYGFVSKRILKDDEKSIVEMPAIGEPGSCLLGVAFYHNDGGELVDFNQDVRYWAAGAPCGYMKHDKVFLIPDGVPQFCPNNPNNLPIPIEAYIGIPLFEDNKCFGHFGMCWNKAGLDALRLSWAYVEMLLHALEDSIIERLLEASMNSDDALERAAKPAAQVIPTEYISPEQSWKPYACSLSHELRTPMHGVVGMLDLMHATVQETLDGSNDPNMRRVFHSLRHDIELVQDSSRRAVEAADNVVQAYDLNMQVPSTPRISDDSEIYNETSLLKNGTDQSSLDPVQPNPDQSSAHHKRSRSSDPPDLEDSRPMKARNLGSIVSGKWPELKAGEMKSANHSIPIGETRSDSKDSSIENAGHPSLSTRPDHQSPSKSSYADIRDVLRHIVNESLKISGRPESTVARGIDGGERIAVKTRKPDGQTSTKIVVWFVALDVPQTLQIDERDVAKLVSCLLLNALKFTDEGQINLRVTMSPRTRHLVISVIDTGSGIPDDFMPRLFLPFSREDASLTRQTEGLGLGLMVAKGLARKLGGDLICRRTNTAGPQRGTEFEIRLPLANSEPLTNATTPRRTSNAGNVALVPSEDQPHTPDELVPEDEGKAESSISPSTEVINGEPTKVQRIQCLQTGTSPGIPPRMTEISIDAAAGSKSSVRSGNATCAGKLNCTLASPLDKSISAFVGGASPKPAESRAKFATAHPLTFLVVDDNSVNRYLLVSMLRKLGYKDIYEAYDGAEAVHQMGIDRKAQDQRPIDVILMDIWMPNMDGYQATETIFAMQRKRVEQGLEVHPITVVAVTADVTNGALERIGRIGMAGYMIKPYRLKDLEKKILTCCIAGSLVVQY